MIRGLSALLLVLSLVSTAAAHESRPLHIEIIERGPEVFAVRWNVPPSVPKHNQPEILMPEQCKIEGAGTARARLYHCDGGLSDRRIEVRYKLYNPSVSTLIRLERLSGETRTAALPPNTLTWTVPQRESTWNVAKSYLVLGIRHILGGYDHLLFVACLVLIAGTWRRIVVTVTGFTIAHSVTLALAALDVVRVPVPPIEAAIALSIVFLATEIARGRTDTLTWRHPIAVSMSFGLLHGFGFASVLNDIGLPQTEVPTALLFFNIGVEAGQIVFVLALLGAFLFAGLVLRHVRGSAFLTGMRPRSIQRAAGYGVGVLASIWLIDRVTGFWT